MNSLATGYREIEHTADWELEVWAPDPKSLIEQSARGMYSLAGVSLEDGPRKSTEVEIESIDLESMIVAFLSELLYLGETEGMGFDDLKLTIEEDTLRAQLSGAPIAEMKKEIKAVTYHNLDVQKTERGLEVRIVFDV
jgi:SHS2 domain-containing protein